MGMHNSGRNDTKNPGGSVGFDRIPAARTPENVPDSRTSEQTLGDYLARRNYHSALDAIAEERDLKKPRLTFDEWYQTNWQKCKTGTFDLQNTFELIWKAAQENA